MKRRPRQSGMTLIELMTALTIGLFMLAGLLQVFVSARQTSRMQENLSRLQENGRFALDFMAKDVRMAGFTGCNNGGAQTNTLNNPDDFYNDFDNAIQGFEATSPTDWTPAMVPEIVSPVGGSDVITIRRADEQAFVVTTHATPTASLTLDASATNDALQNAGFITSAGASKCATAAVADCSSVSIFQITGVAGTVLSHATAGCAAPGNSTDDLNKTFVGGLVYPINTISYYVGTNPGGAPSLYRRTGRSAATELVEDIDLLVILYGEDTDGDGTANYYVAADQVADMLRVVSVRISAQARTPEGNLISTAGGGDGRIRRVFTTTLDIRNR